MSFCPSFDFTPGGIAKAAKRKLTKSTDARSENELVKVLQEIRDVLVVLASVQGQSGYNQRKLKDIKEFGLVEDFIKVPKD